MEGSQGGHIVDLKTDIIPGDVQKGLLLKAPGPGRIRLQMLDWQPALLTAAGVSTSVMRVGGDSQELIPQIHLGSRTTQRRAWSVACLALFLFSLRPE